MPGLDLLLARDPSTATWNALVDRLDDPEHPPSPELLARARTTLARWPAALARPLPYHWISRLAAGDFPPAALADALCLGDRWALDPGVTLDHFATLPRARLPDLCARLPALRLLDVSCQTADNPYSPGTMLYHVDDLAHFLDAPPFTNLVGLDLSGTGLDLAAIDHILEHHPQLRSLALAVGDSDSFDDDDDWPALLDLPGLARLEQLELGNMGRSADAMRTLLTCPHLGNLQRLVYTPEATILREDGLDDREFTALLAAAAFAPAIRQKLRQDHAESSPSFTPGALFSPIFPGPPGRPFARANDANDANDASENDD